MASKRELRNLSKMNLRMYEAANTDRLVNSWDSQPWTIDQIIFTQLEKLRARAREQTRNNAYLSKLVLTLQNNIVGASGFQVKPCPVDSKGVVDELAGRVVKAGWNGWTEEIDLVSMEHLIMAALVTDGESILIIKQGRNRQIVPTFVDPALLDVNYNRNEKGKNIIKFGIEYDDYKRPVKYWFNDDYSTHHPMVGNTAHANVNRTGVPAENVIHIFRKQWVGQTRGIPWAAVALADLFQVGRYKSAAVTAARIGAAKMGFFSNEDGEEYKGDEESGGYNLNAEAGTFENIGNMRFEPFDPTYPAGEFEVFLNKVLQGISAGVGVDAHTITNDLSGVNYSSARVGMLETREYYKTIQNWFVSACIRPLYQKWLSCELIMGRLKAGNMALNRGLEYYKPARFQGRRWDWVDPSKEMDGKAKAYNLRTTSISQIIRERGDDPAEVFKEIAEEKKQLEQMGISPETVMGKLKQEGKKKNADN
jgi:lambda family phage portal protein